MISLINTARPVALYLIILISGLYGGLHFTGIMNPSVFGVINPVGALMPSVQWAASWQITDGFMRVRMGIFGPIILYGYLLTLLLFIRQWRSATFWLILLAFGLFIADLVLTVQQQIPINRYIERIDFQKLTPEQTKNLTVMHHQVIANFASREWFSLAGFVLVALAPFFWYRSQQQARLQPPNRLHDY